MTEEGQARREGDKAGQQREEARLGTPTWQDMAFRKLHATRFQS